MTSSGTKGADRDDDSLPKVLGDDRMYRPIIATVNNMATDMPDLQFACKEACQSWKKVKRIGWYLLGREKVVWMWGWVARRPRDRSR